MTQTVKVPAMRSVPSRSVHLSGLSSVCFLWLKFGNILYLLILFISLFFYLLF